MAKNKRKAPVIGCAFDPDFRDENGNINAYIAELEYYRPRGFAKLAAEGRKLANANTFLSYPRPHSNEYRGIHADDIGQHISEWKGDCDSMLSEYGRKHGSDYHCYGPFPHGGAIGFYIDVEGAQESADLTVADLSEVPTGFSGLVVHVNDHGNVSAYSYSRGKARELFAVV